MTTATPRGSGTAEPDALQATLRVEPHPDAGCALLAAGERGEDVVHSEVGARVTADRADAGGDGAGGDADDGPGEDADGSGEACCRTAVTVTEDGESRRELVRGRIGEHCVCPAFREVDCAADVRGFGGGALTVAVTVPDRETLRELVRELRSRDATVRLVRILPLSEAGADPAASGGDLTEKQREALETAVAMGYYDRPREADLSDLAGALDVSRSAVSQRLNAAEARLVQRAVDLEAAPEAAPAAADADEGDAE